MNILKNIFLSLLFLILFGSCHSIIGSEFRAMNCYVGHWIYETKENKLYEIWTKNKDGNYVGRSFMLVDKDSVFSETMLLELNRNKIEYKVSVKNQNRNEQVIFKYKEKKNNDLVFENPNHDFPQRIIYSIPKADSFKARIEGNKDGSYLEESFNFVRVKGL
jgi:hypothetical protein